ncbi:DUF2303 family protein [Deefgea piscis]|uniref:DUF2303 family protein n=1 Tax=Deefgea piscis TaxID=2739061 RepID=UPI001C7E9731|nr:DUF2303 family protein [Deefgea piscis]QZA80211.1 YfdQ family protein [Deefgea piscis]
MPAEQIEAELVSQPSAVAQILKAAQKPFQENVELEAYREGYRPVVFIPNGYKAEYPDFEKHLDTPLRKTGTVRLDDAESFVWYLKEHGQANRTRTYLQADYAAGKVSFTALLNDHQGGYTEQNWRDHKALFTPANSVEWNTWTKNNREPMMQTEFATFLEDNLANICVIEGLPTATDMMEMVLNFEATNEKRFKSAARLQSGGINFEYIDQEDSVTSSKMKVFERFAIAIPVFVQPIAATDAIVGYRIDCRLKYRIKSGALLLWFELVREDKVLEAAAKDIVAQIQNDSGFPLIAGNPFA